jgi:hypothetical protein
LPVVSDATVIGEVVPDADCVVPPLLDVHVAVKLVIAVPPVLFAVKATIPERFPNVTPVTLGAAGAEAATNELEAVDAALSPVPLVATTVHVYVLLFVSELTAIGDVAPDADWRPGGERSPGRCGRNGIRPRVSSTLALCRSGERLIRALGADAVEAVIDAHGELSPFTCRCTPPFGRAPAIETAPVVMLHRNRCS